MKIKIQRLLIFLLISCGLLLPTVLFAQSPGPVWSAPLQLFYTNGYASAPIIVTDAYDAVHVFWYEGAAPTTNPGAVIPISRSSGPSAIYHISNDGGRWSKPVDVVLSPGNQGATDPEVTADRFGRLHLIWIGPNTTLYYSSVDSRRAGDAREWSVPKAIGRSFGTADIAADSKGNLHVVDPGASGEAVYYSASLDGGVSWSNPVTVALPSPEDAIMSQTQMAFDSSGAIHVVWTVYQSPDAWPPLGVFYSRSTDGGATWSAPYRLAADGYDEATIKVSADDLVHIVWNGMAGVGGRYYVESQNGGRSWSKPVSIIPPGQGGTSGYPDFAFDSSGVLHAVTPADGIQYLSFQKGDWSTPFKISDDLTGGKRVTSVEQSRIAISQGNRLNVVFEVGYQEIYYASLLTGAPLVRPQPIPTELVPSPQVTVAATALPGPTWTATPTPMHFEEGVPPVETGASNWFALLLGAVPASLLLLLVGFARLARRGR